MSAGNASAVIGLANTNKIPPLGVYVQDAGVQPSNGNGNPGPGANGEFIGVNGHQYWDRNWLGELVNPAYQVNANSGAVTGRVAQWVTNTSPIAAATTRVDVSGAGVITANNDTGLFDIFCVQAAAMPANSFCWAFQR